MDPQVEVITSGRPYRGRIITVREDRLKLDGEEMGREVVEHPGAAAILAWEGDGLIMVQQYRHPVSQVLWEIPAGLLEPGERPLACARRELAEETGFKGGQWKFLLQFYSTPGFCNEIIHLYEARGLQRAAARPEADEPLRMVKIPFSTAISMVSRGKIKDAKTIIALSLATAGKGSINRSPAT